MQALWIILGAVLGFNVLLVAVLYLLGETVRFGAVVSWTRALFGVDYDKGLLAFHLGPVALCVAWGEPENNPFVTQEQLDEMENRKEE